MIQQNLPPLNRQLTGAGVGPIKVKSESEADGDDHEASANPHAGKDDPDAVLERQHLPATVRPCISRRLTWRSLPGILVAHE
jgi:hypothetical protein